MMICLALLELLSAFRQTDGGQSEFNNCFTIMEMFDKFDTVMLVAAAAAAAAAVVVVVLVVVVVFNNALSNSDYSALTISNERKGMQTLIVFA
jgi:hypothetical protein